jgi:hypothetical protein
MSKGIGSAFGFFLVLLVLGLGMYVALTGFQSSRAALLAEPSSSPKPATSTPRPATSTPDYTPIPTPVPGLTLTQTAMAMPPTSTATPLGAKPEKPAAATKAATPTTTATSASAASFPFRLAAPPAPEPQSGCCYILGMARDAAGVGLEGVLIQAFNEWTRLPPTPTKGGIELGKYDIPIGTDKVTWYVVVVDADGNPLSPQASLTFDPGVAPAVRVDWKKIR